MSIFIFSSNFILQVFSSVHKCLLQVVFLLIPGEVVEPLKMVLDLQVDPVAMGDSNHNYFLEAEVTRNSMPAFYQMYRQIQMCPVARGQFQVVVESMDCRMDYNLILIKTLLIFRLFLPNTWRSRR